jgi:hypothetical protein
MKMEQIECSETSAYKIKTPGNYPEEIIRYSEHGEILKSRLSKLIYFASFSYVALLILLKFCLCVRSPNDFSDHMSLGDLFTVL